MNHRSPLILATIWPRSRPAGQARTLLTPRLVLAALLGLLTASVALAAPPDLPDLLDPSAWGALWNSHAHLAFGLIVPTIETIKTIAPELVRGPLGSLTTLVVGAIAGVLGLTGGFLDASFLGAVAFGLFSGVLAIGGWELVLKHLRAALVALAAALRARAERDTPPAGA